MNAFKEGFEKSRHSVCYNGDIFRRKDYDRLVKEYPDLDKIMMGRGIMMNPFLMEEIADGTSQKVSGKMSADRKADRLEKFHRLGAGWPSLLRRGYTLLAVNFLWMLFRSDTLAYAGQFFLVMLGLGGTGGWNGTCSLYLQENAVILAFALLFSVPFARRLREGLETWKPCGKDPSLLWDLLYALGLTALGLLAVASLVKGTYNPFIYFRF